MPTNVGRGSSELRSQPPQCRIYSVDARRGPRIPSLASFAEHRLEVTDMPKNLTTATSVGFARLALGEMA